MVVEGSSESTLPNPVFHIQRAGLQRGNEFWSRSQTLVETQLGLEPSSADPQAKALCTVCIP